MKLAVPFFFMCLLALFLSSCGSRKKLVRLETSTRQVINIDSVGVTNRVIETKQYGASLIGKGSLSAKGDSIVLKSKGIDLKLKLTPKTNTDGHISGYELDYNATATPTETTNTTEVQQAKTNKSVLTDAHTESEEQTKTSWSWPWYVWLLSAGIIAGLLIRFLKPKKSNNG